MAQEAVTKMGISPEHSGNVKNQKQGKGDHMSDVATANFLVEQIGGKRQIGDMIYTAFKELSKRFPHREDPHNKWTERRLRGWWNGESEVVKHFQMLELYETAEAIKAARDEHAEYIAKTQRLRQMAELRKAAHSRDVGSR